MNQSELEANACNRRQARENTCDHVTIGFGLVSHWLRKWREFCKSVQWLYTVSIIIFQGQGKVMEFCKRSGKILEVVKVSEKSRN